ncbi:MAG TPA: hypothetical protein P5121_12350 [Caldilineaceae bacterium]|nr:hypothetical protein [Caldilineaceae bacterium]
MKPFEFLQIYQQFLLVELTTADEARRARALWVQEKLPFRLSTE